MKYQAQYQVSFQFQDSTRICNPEPSRRIHFSPFTEPIPGSNAQTTRHEPTCDNGRFKPMHRCCYVQSVIALDNRNRASFFALPAVKDPGIETLRGFAVILMVAGHVVAADSQFAIEDNGISAWKLVYAALQDIRMPLFTVLSGFLYAGRPIDASKSYPSFVKAKVRRLILPLLTVSALLFITKLAMPDETNEFEFADAWRPYVYGIDHLWFLQSIFLIFLVVGLFDLLGAISHPVRWATITTIFFGIFVMVSIPPQLDLFSVSGAVRLLPFFLLGYGLRRFKFSEVKPQSALGLAGLFLAVYIPRMAVLVNFWDFPVTVQRLLAVATGVLGVLLLFWSRRFLTFIPLAWMGTMAFGIYLLHYFAYSAAKFGLERLGINELWLKFTVGLLVGIALPILFIIFTGRMRWVRLLVLGEKTRR